MACLCLVPVIAMMAISVEATSSLNKQTRLLQAQSVAALALAKEGKNIEKSYLNKMLVFYIQENMKSVLKNSENISPTFRFTAQNVVYVSSKYHINPVFESVLGVAVGDITETEVMAASQTRPLELVLVLDASSSSGSYVEAYKTGIRLILDEVAANTEGNVRISMLAYSTLVNIGWEYKDALVTPESRRFNTDGQRATARGYGIKDALDENGPFRYTHQVCVARPVNLGKDEDISSGEKRQYAEDIEKAPLHPSEGFQLVIADGRNTPTDPYAAENTDVQQVLSRWLSTISSPSSPYHFQGGDVRTVAMVPIAHAIPSEARNFDRFNLWGPKHTAVWRNNPAGGVPLWGQIADQSATMALDCPAMPMVVAKQELEPFYEALEKFSPARFTAPDEGLAWALRLLSPNWKDIWRIENYPAEYDGNTDKKIILIGGSATVGYSQVITSICEKIIENGIELHILSETSEGMDEYAKCAGERYVNAPSAKAFPEIIQQMSRQKKVVALVKDK